GTWSFTPTTALADGTHNLTAVATDKAGNVVTSSALSVIVDTTEIGRASCRERSTTEGGSWDHDDLTKATKPLLTGTVSDANAGDKRQMKDDRDWRADVRPADRGTWSFTPTTALADGTHNLTAVATDKAGNVVTSSALSVIVDTT